MKHSIIKFIKANTELLVAVVSMLLSSQYVEAKYYLYASSNNSTWTKIYESDSKTFTITNATYLAVGTEFQLGVSTNPSTGDDGGYAGTTEKFKKQLYRGGSDKSGSVFDYVSSNDFSSGGCNYAGIKYKLKSSTSSLTLTLTEQSQGHNCGSDYVEENQHKYTLSAGTPVASSWVLVGKPLVGTWTASEGVQFVSAGTNLVALELYLPPSTVYNIDNNPTNGTGFKIVENGSSWYSKSDKMFTSASNSATISTSEGHNMGLTTTYAGIYRFEFNTNTKNLTIIFPKKYTSPVAYWGALPAVNGSKDISASAYIKTTGCDGSSVQTVTQLKARYWKKSDPTNVGTEIITNAGGYAQGLSGPHTITIDHKSPILKSCTIATDIVMDVAAYSGTGWSDYSDNIVYSYTADKTLETFAPTCNFTQCEGSHSIKLSDIVVPTEDVSWDVQVTGTPGSVKGTHFKPATDGSIEWVNFSAAAGDYDYTFTFTRDGYTSANQNITVHYAKSVPTGGIADIFTSLTPDGEGKLKTTSWVPVTLTTSINGGSSNVSDIKWTVDRVANVDPNSPSTTAVFRAKSTEDDLPFVITATGISSTCTELSPSKQVTIYVSPDRDGCK